MTQEQYPINWNPEIITIRDEHPRKTEEEPSKNRPLTYWGENPKGKEATARTSSKKSFSASTFLYMLIPVILAAVMLYMYAPNKTDVANLQAQIATMQDQAASIQALSERVDALETEQNYQVQIDDLDRRIAQLESK